MIHQIALFPILGAPLIVYGGLFTLLLLLATAAIGAMIMKGKKISIKSHLWLARLAIVVAIIHGILGASIFLNF